MSDACAENIAGLTAAVASMGHHAEVIATMAANLKSQVADAERRLAALREAERRGK